MIFFISLVIISLFSAEVSAQIPRNLTYQGILTNSEGAPLPDTLVELEFSLYAQSQGGNPLWEESQSVDLRAGVFDIELGSQNALDLPFDRAYWLGIVYDGHELLPRTRMTASAYAMTAKTVEDNGITAEAIAQQQVVKSINGLRDHLLIEGGANVHVITGNASAITIDVSQPVIATDQAGATTNLAADWTAYQDCSVALHCPGAGKVIVNSTAWVRLSHAANVADRVELANSESSVTNTSAVPYWSSYEIPASAPATTESMDISIPVQTVFTVNSDTTITYYLMGRMVTGFGAGDVFWYANMVATWYPAAQATMSNESAPMQEKSR